jgi:hypothetical protein
MFRGDRAAVAKAEGIVMVNHRQDYAPAVHRLKHPSFRARLFVETENLLSPKTQLNKQTERVDVSCPRNVWDSARTEADEDQNDRG